MTSDPKPADQMGFPETCLAFLQMRRDLEQLVKDVELSNFSLSYGARTAREFRQKLGQMQTLLDKMVELVGPEKEAPLHVV